MNFNILKTFIVTAAIMILTANTHGSALVVLIPGSGSSGDKIFISGANGILKLLDLNQYFKKFQEELANNGVPSIVCPTDEDEDQRSIEERASACQDQILNQLQIATSSFGQKNDGIVPEYSQIYGTYLGHIETDHWGSACVDPVQNSDGCKTTLKLVIPHLKVQAMGIDTSLTSSLQP